MVVKYENIPLAREASISIASITWRKTISANLINAESLKRTAANAASIVSVEAVTCYTRTALRATQALQARRNTSLAHFGSGVTIKPTEAGVQTGVIREVSSLAGSTVGVSIAASEAWVKTFGAHSVSCYEAQVAGREAGGVVLKEEVGSAFGTLFGGDFAEKAGRKAGLAGDGGEVGEVAGQASYEARGSI